MLRMKWKKTGNAGRGPQDSLSELLELLKPVEKKSVQRLSKALKVFSAVYVVVGICGLSAQLLSAPPRLVFTINVLFLLLTAVFLCTLIIPFVLIRGVLRNPSGEYALGLQRRIEREADLLRFLERKTNDFLALHASRIKLEVELIQRRNTYAVFVVLVCGFLATQLSHTLIIGKYVLDLQWSVPALIAVPLGVAFGSVLLFETMERFDRIGFALNAAIEARSARPKLRYEPSSGRQRDRRGTP
jgi:hypothetical protein